MNSSNPPVPPPGQYYPSEPVPESNESGGVDRMRKTWLMVLERKWYALAVLFLTLIATTVYTLRVTPYYAGVVTIQILKHGPQVLRVADVVESSITSDTDFNTQIKVLESMAIIQNVAARLTPDEIKLLTDPYKSGSGEAPSPATIISKRRILPQRMSLITTIEFMHPNAKMAARIANLIAAEYISYNSRLRVEESLKAVDDLKDRADQQRKRVDEIATSLQAFRQRGNLISLVQSKDIVTEKLKALNMMTTQTSQHLAEAQVRWSQVQNWTKSDRDLSELPFIASQPKVSQLLLQLTTQKLALAQLRERYKEKHPRLIEAVNSVNQTELELQIAIATGAASIKAEYENAVQNDEGARQALAGQETKSLDLDKSAVEYDNLTREYRVNEELLQSMMTRMRETTVTSSIETENARIIDHAYESGTPISPKLAVNLTMGGIAGIILGLAFAVLIGTLDDRIKTIFDVETLIGLPLLGVIPRVDRMDLADKAQIVSNGVDRSVVEAFLSVYSNLRINDSSRNAKLILVTSTVPGEGKSFITTNLGLTFASQGQRTVIVDCDLRKPNIERSFRLNTTKGVASYCTDGTKLGFAANEARLDEVVVKNVHPNLDIITVGGRVKNPIHLLNSSEFEQLVSELGKRYDRVLFDTPPLGAVSDALNILPLMDGVIYAIKFSGVKRGLVQRSTKRLMATNVPIFGAVMNGMSTGIVGDYYMESDSKAFKKYYEPELIEAPKSIAS
jgi:capsular exopolysaccharide synthesis family protein